MGEIALDTHGMKMVHELASCDGNHIAAMVKEMMVNSVTENSSYRKDVVGLVRQNELLQYRSHEILRRFNYCPLCGCCLTFRYPRASDRVNGMFSWVIDAACEVYGIPVDEFFSGSRTECAVDCRDAVAFILRKKFNETFPNIGRLLRRDHSSVMSAVSRFGTRLEMYGRYNKLFQQFEKLVDEH